MWQSFKEESSDNKYVNKINSKSSTAKRLVKNNNNRTNCQTIDILSIEAASSASLEQQQQQHGAKCHAVSTILSNNKLQKQQQQQQQYEFGGLATASRLKAHAPHERHTNMHSSAVVADSTAVIVNIGGCDQSADTTTTTTNTRTTNHNQQQQLRNTSVRVRRTSSGASYSEVALGTHRRERKISSSSQTSKYGNKQQKRTVSPQVSPQPNRQQRTRHLRAEQSSIQQNVNAQQHRHREQSPKPSESPRGLARRRHRTPPNKLRQHSIETTENASINKIPRRQRESSFSSSTASSCNGSCSSDDGDSNTTSTSSGEPNLPYPGFPEVALKYLTQDTRPRNWCLMMITNPYPFFYKLHKNSLIFFRHTTKWLLGKKQVEFNYNLQTSAMEIL